MSTTSLAAAALCLVGEGLLAALVIRMGLAANRRGENARAEDTLAARLLFIAAPLLILGTLLRVLRYVLEGPSEVWEVAVTAVLQGAAWVLTLLAIGKLAPVDAQAFRSSALLSVGTGTATALLVINATGDGDGLKQAFIGLSFGLLAAVFGSLSLRLKATGESGWMPGFALIAAQGLLLVLVLRAFLLNGAPPSVKEFLRVLLSGGVLLMTAFAYPALAEFTARLDARHAKALRPQELEA